jgi:hypothetical protein
MFQAVFCLFLEFNKKITVVKFLAAIMTYIKIL